MRLHVYLAVFPSLDTVQKRHLDMACMKRKVRILILCKTYPSPSAKYAETSCVAGMDEEGKSYKAVSSTVPLDH